MSFSFLPLELLQQIAVCVELEHRPSLYAFSLTSKACHRALTCVIFRQITIVAHNREALQSDVDRLFDALSRTDSVRYVQCVSIKGALRLKPKKMHKNYQEKAYWARHGLDEILVDEETIDFTGPHIVYDEGVIEKSSEEDMAWAPVVSLLLTIPNLKDLVYNCQSQFPPCLLSILHKQHPQCRLHHLTFRFRTLLWGVPKPYEMELATSPSLYRVKVACGRRDTDGDDDFNLEAIMELASGLAPNLKEVVILGLEPMLSGRPLRAREPWHGLPGFTGNAVGRLNSLLLKGFLWFDTTKQIQHWARHTDFAYLQHLALGGCYEGVHRCGISGETMEWIAQHHSFPRLRKLRVYLTRDDMWHERPNYTENAIAFFQTFESLVELFIDGPFDSDIMHAVLSQHGQTIRKLGLNPAEQTWDKNYTSTDLAGNVTRARNPQHIPMEFTKDFILQIQEKCPLLEDLSIKIKRSMSSSSEVGIYQSFGKMKNLRFLFVNLDCSNWKASRDKTYRCHFNDEEDRKLVNKECWYSVTRGLCKETLINCAVDEELARSFWNVINQNKAGKRLERLSLWTTGGGDYGCSHLRLDNIGILQDLIRSWLIKRVPRPDQQDIIVKEIAPGARNFDGYNMRHIQKSDVLKIFHEIWPSKEGSQDWRDDWSSFPLQV